MATAVRVAPISQDCSDADLVAAVRQGNDAAFEELYSRYSARIGAYVRGMVTDHGRAEDITQEIFISALRRMRETDRPIAFKPWIYEIAKNACIDSFRRTRRAQEVSLDADDGLSSADRGRLTVVTTPDAALDSKQALQDLRGAFGGLSDSHHEILVLRELEGRSYSDIGARLGMSRPMVESTLFRARRRLAEEYEELVSGRRCEFVGKMVDSGPHYSLGIRDRRRIARHVAHCQPCRARARAAGFDEGILNMPGAGAKIAAFLPIPLLRGRYASIENVGSSRGRPSLLALRSVHALARSSDPLTVAGPAAGRGAAAAAAIVIASVGGGIVTAASSSPAKAPHSGALHATPYHVAGPLAAGLVGPLATRSGAPFVSAKMTSTHGRAGAAAPAASASDIVPHGGPSIPGRGATDGLVPMGAPPTRGPSSGTGAPLGVDQTGSGATESAGPAGVGMNGTGSGAAGTDAAGTDTSGTGPGAGGAGSGAGGAGGAGAGAGDNGAAGAGTGGSGGTGAVADPVSTGTGLASGGTSALPTGTGTPSTGSLSGGSLPTASGTLSSTLGTVTGAAPELPPRGTQTAGPVAGTLGGVTGGVGNLLGH